MECPECSRLESLIQETSLIKGRTGTDASNAAMENDPIKWNDLQLKAQDAEKKAAEALRAFYKHKKTH